MPLTSLRQEWGWNISVNLCADLNCSRGENSNAFNVFVLPRGFFFYSGLCFLEKWPLTFGHCSDTCPESFSCPSSWNSEPSFSHLFLLRGARQYRRGCACAPVNWAAALQHEDLISFVPCSGILILSEMGIVWLLKALWWERKFSLRLFFPTENLLWQRVCVTGVCLRLCILATCAWTGFLWGKWILGDNLVVLLICSRAKVAKKINTADLIRCQKPFLCFSFLLFLFDHQYIVLRGGMPALKLALPAVLQQWGKNNKQTTNVLETDYCCLSSVLFENRRGKASLCYFRKRAQVREERFGSCSYSSLVVTKDSGNSHMMVWLS